jgi:hypothetical protein
MNTPDINFNIEDAEPVRFGASPQIDFKLRISNDSGVVIQSVLLKCQIDLEVSRRHYSAAEQQHLADLFGEPSRWGETLRRMLWANTNVIVPSFEEIILLDVLVPCTFDFNIGATKYFAGLQGDIPLSFYFSGTIFYSGRNGSLQAGQISWEKEAFYRMPVRIWQDMMDAYYPNTAWLCLQRDAFDRLVAYKTRHGIPTFEQTLMRLMETMAEATQ